MTTIMDRLERERLLRRLAEGDVDEELRRVLRRMRTFIFGSWAALDELYLFPGADPSKLARWREVSEHSPESRKAVDQDRAIGILGFWFGISGA